MTLKHYLIVAGLILAAMILAAQLARPQGNVRHAPTVEQCHADANVWMTDNDLTANHRLSLKRTL